VVEAPLQLGRWTQGVLPRTGVPVETVISSSIFGQCKGPVACVGGSACKTGAWRWCPSAGPGYWAAFSPIAVVTGRWTRGAKRVCCNPYGPIPRSSCGAARAKSGPGGCGVLSWVCLPLRGSQRMGRRLAADLPLRGPQWQWCLDLLA